MRTISDGVTCVLNDTLDLPLSARELGVFVYCLARSQSGEPTTVTDLLGQFPELCESDIDEIERQIHRIEARATKKPDGPDGGLAAAIWNQIMQEVKTQ